MKVDSYEADLMRQCQRGMRWQGGNTGSFCRKRDLCRAEGRCHFVAQVERHMERAWTPLKRGQIVWSSGFDAEPNTRHAWAV